MPLTRRGFLGAAASITSGRLAASDPPTLRRSNKPNILWITCEDMCPDLGCYGDPWACTPNLDRLARQGTRFTNAFSVYGVCAPSRSSIITGYYPASIGTHHMRSQGVPPSHVKCITEFLRAEGYYCTNNVKTDYNFDSPLTAWDESSTRAHWRNRPKGQRFFSVFNITTTHESQIWPENHAKLAALKPEERHDPARAKLPPYYPDTPATRADWARYYDLITLMDRQAGELLKQLDEDGLTSDTAVFFFSDHGRGLPRAKRWVYDASLHVPLIVRWRGFALPGPSDRLVSLVDLAETMMYVADTGRRTGAADTQCFLHPFSRYRRYIYAGRDRMDETYDMIRAVRDKRYKYIRNFQPGKPYAQYIDYMEKGETMKEMRRLNKDGKLTGAQRLFFLPEKPPEELYDTFSDPHEVNNLDGSFEHQAVLKRMREELDVFMKRSGDLGLVPEEELKERMRPGGVWSVTKAPEIEPNGGSFSGPVQVRIGCPTEGSSIAWTTDSAENPRWNLHCRPITLERSATLRAKACRLGYKDSPEVHAAFHVG